MKRDLEGVTVIAPCLNEEGNLPLLVERLHAALAPLPVPTELVLVDDGSRDGTWARIQDAQSRAGRARNLPTLSHPCENAVGCVEFWVYSLSG